MYKYPYKIAEEQLPPYLALADWAKLFGICRQTITNNLTENLKKAQYINSKQVFSISGIQQPFANKNAVLKYICEKYGDKRRQPPITHKIPEFKICNDNMYPIRQYRHTYIAVPSGGKYVVPANVRNNKICWDEIAELGTDVYFNEMLVKKRTTRVWRWMQDCGLRYILCGKKRIINKKDLMQFLCVTSSGIYYGKDMIDITKRKYVEGECV